VTDNSAGARVDDGDVPAEKRRGRIGRPRRDAGEPPLVLEDFARRLVAQAREEGLDLLQPVMMSVLEAALSEKLTDHLGYEHQAPAGTEASNRTVMTAARTAYGFQNLDN
jgi:hypothetical protein